MIRRPFLAAAFAALLTSGLALSHFAAPPAPAQTLPAAAAAQRKQLPLQLQQVALQQPQEDSRQQDQQQTEQQPELCAPQQSEPDSNRKSQRPPRKDSKQRAEPLPALAERFELGEGDTVADIGAGNGRDSWVFAEIVGSAGTVFAEEITESKVAAIKKGAEERKLSQVKPVLGRVDDPCLPEAAVDFAFMHYVYHHVTKPREMLRGIRRALKPGGYFVVVDRHRGTLRDWVPREERGPRHFWIAETTVVREAREEGFLFVACAEDCWPQDDQFVLVFQRPKEEPGVGGDPDPFAPLALEELRRQLLPAHGKYQRPVFIALGEARQLIGPILERSEQEGLDIVLEEWATRRDERPPLTAGVELPSVLTEQGDPDLDDKPVDVVFFLDTYHLLFHHETLLAKLAERLGPDGEVYVLDRRAQESASHREASHRRKIAPQLVKQEMKEAGFRLLDELKAPAPDRFLLVFGKREEGEATER